MTAYYNEHDAYAAQWLRNLIAAGHIADGDVDERSIEDVLPRDLDGYTQCHFFAGIGVWSYALRRSGWADDRPVWTGSCPCQPFSAAGKGAAFDDERHLWPAFHHLIKECSPAIVFGEQVASKDADGWIDLVQADLEGVGYALGGVPFPAAGVGAFHLRDRLYWLAYPEGKRWDWGQDSSGSAGRLGVEAGSSGERMGDTSGERCRKTWGPGNGSAQWAANAGTDGGMADPVLSDEARQRSVGVSMESKQEAGGSSSPHRWQELEFVRCADGKARPIEPSIQPLAHGATGRVGRLRAYGNAIHAGAAQAFISSVMDLIPC